MTNSCLRLRKIADILTVTKNPALKDHIIRKCGISNYHCKDYIMQLVEAGLLDVYPTVNMKHISGPKSRRRMTYQTSRKGHFFLKRYKELQELLGEVTKRGVWIS